MSYLVAIAGPSGAGKTTLALSLAAALEAPILSLDSYYRDLRAMAPADRARVNFDEPSALDRDLLAAQVADLAANHDIAVPVYDFATHTRVPETQLLRAAPSVVIEGIFALYWEDIRALVGTAVFVCAGDDICYGRRLERDIRERGRSPESVEWQYRTTVRPMAERHVLPTLARADVVVSGTDPLACSVAAVLAHVRQHRTPR